MSVVTDSDKPDAVIFIPDMDNYVGIDTIAERFAAELDRNTASAEVGYTVETRGDLEAYPSSITPSTKERVRTIYRRSGGDRVPVVDLYILEYAKTLSDAWKRRNLLMQSLVLLFIIVLGIPRFLRALFFGKSKKLTEKIQIFYAIFVLLVLSGYTLIVVFAVIGTVLQMPDLFNSVFAPIVTSQEMVPYTIVTFAQVTVIFTALIQSFFPDVRRKLLDFAVNLVGVINYINVGEYKSVIAGRFVDLLDYLAAKKSYNRVHVIAYSMGSIIALDNIFPYNEQPAPRVKEIYSLTTLGCVFDFVRLFWPKYFEDRCLFEDAPRKWFNVYSPVDVVGSNFRDDMEIAEANRSIKLKNPSGDAKGGKIGPLPENIVYTGGVNVRDISFVQWLTLFGIRSHGVYFESKEYVERGCLNGVIGRLYEGQPILN